MFARTKFIMPSRCMLLFALKQLFFSSQKGLIHRNYKLLSDPVQTIKMLKIARHCYLECQPKNTI